MVIVGAASTPKGLSRDADPAPDMNQRRPVENRAGRRQRQRDQQEHDGPVAGDVRCERHGAWFAIARVPAPDKIEGGQAEGDQGREPQPEDDALVGHVLTLTSLRLELTTPSP